MERKSGRLKFSKNSVDKRAPTELKSVKLSDEMKPDKGRVQKRARGGKKHQRKIKPRNVNPKDKNI